MDFFNADEKNGFRVKLWRGERMCMLGFDVAQPEPDFVGFAIECKEPGDADFHTLKNRLAFSYPTDQPDGFKKFDSISAPFQKFRWIHFPKDPRAGGNIYRVTKMHMPTDAPPVPGEQIVLDIDLNPVTYADFIDVGFTRNFASSQAYAEKFGNRQDVLPAKADQGLDFDKSAVGNDLYEWLGFEAVALLFRTVNEVVLDPSLTLDVLAYDLNEPDLVAAFAKVGPRLRIVVDDSADHGEPTSAETRAAGILAGAGAQVTRTHFRNLQHHKVLIVSKNGKPIKALCGSTNFSFRGFYIQANNAILFTNDDIAALFAQMFTQAFKDPNNFSTNAIALKWHLPSVLTPHISFCFSPHDHTELSLNPIGSAIDQATSSVFFSIAFLNQILSGPVREAIDRLEGRPVFSYGVVNQTGKKLAVHKPDGSVGIVDFAFLSDHAPSPFKEEWRAGGGINIHHKFVVTDFNRPNAKVFMGSCNMSPSGEHNNGDNLVMIEDPQIATAYAIEAARLFDHLHFRANMQDVPKDAGPITLQKPLAIKAADETWFDRFYVAGSQNENDRKVFSE